MRTRRSSPLPGALPSSGPKNPASKSSFSGYSLEGNQVPAFCVCSFGNLPEASMAGLIGVAIYFAPSLIAAARHTHNATGIFMLNLFLGWTGIGWVIALLVALCFSPDWKSGEKEKGRGG